jgi:outer membrane protein TolC
MGTTPCRAFLVASACIGLSGCAVGPDYDPPAVAVPKAFGTATLSPGVASAPATFDFVRWWQILHDPQLDWLIERAVAGNPDIEIALTRVQEARLQQNVVFGAMLPTVAGRGGIATGSAGDLMRSRAGLTLRAGDSTRGFGSISRMAGFDSSWELDLFGKLQRSLEAASDDAEKEVELRNAVLITVIADVARNYFDFRALQMRLEMARKDVATVQRTVDLAMTKFKRGPSNESEPKQEGTSPKGKSSKEESRSPKQESKSSASNTSDDTAKPKAQESKQESKSSASNELNLILAKGELATQLARLPELESEISAAESRLAVLLGTYEVDIAGAIRGPSKLPALPERLRPGAPVDMLRRRPDIRAVERELAAATARIGVATADLFPSVTLTSGFGGQGTTGRTTSTPLVHGPIWSVGPGVDWPLLDFGRLDALIDIQELRTHEVLVRYKKTIIAAVEEVNQATRQYRLDLQRWKALSAALEALRHAVAVTMERYERGDSDFRALLDAQRRKFALEEQAATAAEAVILRYVTFYKALGGGWEPYDELPPLPPVQPAIIAGVGRLTGGWHGH